MKNLKKVVWGSLLVCTSVLATSQSEKVEGIVGTWVAQPESNLPNDSLYSKRIQQATLTMQSMTFNNTIRDHRLRRQRIQYYLTQARRYEQQQWLYSRDDALYRANLIMSHHEQLVGQSYAL